MQDGDNDKVQKSEVWKPVHGFEHNYEVSSHGRIRRKIKSTPVNTFQSSNKYLSVALGTKRGGKRTLLSLHRVVARAFLGECPAGLVCNHKDGDRHNNMLSNLEYISSRENTTHGKTSKGLVGASWHKRHKKWQSQMRINGAVKFLGMYSTELEAHKAYMTKLREIGADNKYAGVS